MAEEFSWTRVTANYFQLYDKFHEWFGSRGSAQRGGKAVVCSGRKHFGNGFARGALNGA